MSDWIRFLGTAGARFAVSKQLRSSAGTWCFIQGVNFLIDPGPGTLTRCFTDSIKLDPENLEAIILTHRHLDHSNDLNVMVEAMTRGTFHQRGALFVPGDAIKGREPVVFSYIQASVDRLELLQEGGSYRLGNLVINTPVRHRHPVETYGLQFRLPYGTVSFIVDTRYFDELVDHYRGSDILILNVLLLNPPGAGFIQHLDLHSAETLIREIKPELAVMTHFGTTMLKNKPPVLARQLAEKTGVQVIAAYDGMKLDIQRPGKN